MQTFEILIGHEKFWIKLNSLDCYTFSVFNHTTFHILKKNDCGIWKDVEHRFGKDTLPHKEIGAAIDEYCLFCAVKAAISGPA